LRRAREETGGSGANAAGTAGDDRYLAAKAQIKHRENVVCP
jgi:hypothetical protein